MNLPIPDRQAYLTAEPFPNVYYDGVFEPIMLHNIREEVEATEVTYINQRMHVKGSCDDYSKMGHFTQGFIDYLNSRPFLDFLTALTGIENLIPDPYLIGGGIHKIRRGGELGLHADFSYHQNTRLDRRINVLIYLNNDWKEEYGGHFELWNQDRTKCVKRILPIFNRMAIFSTTSTSFRGHPDPLTCPPDRQRTSIAMYYYTNGRNDGAYKHGTLFFPRKGNTRDKKQGVKFFIKQFIPPVVFTILNKLNSK